MPDQARYKLTISGSYCATPFAFSASYKQYGPDQPGKTTEQVLIDHWFNDASNVWSLLDNFLSADVKIECVVVATATNVTVVYVNNRTGGSVGPSFPPDIAVQVNFSPVQPWPGKSLGRMFLPGWLVSNARMGCITALAATNIQPALEKMREKTIASTPFLSMLPHFDWTRGPNSPDEQIEVPWIEPALKRLKSRQLSACAAFSGGGANAGLPSLPEAIP